MQEKLAYVALGANLSGRDGIPPLQSCTRALTRISSIDGVRVLARSRWFSTAPIPASDQPRYINGVVCLSCRLGPDRLLAGLAAIEQAAGRVRGGADAPRTLDLDIIDIGGEVRLAPDPVLPHPRAHLRAFVLYPLRDVAPRWRHPVLRADIDVLIGALESQDTHVV